MIRLNIGLTVNICMDFGVSISIALNSSVILNFSFGIIFSIGFSDRRPIFHIGLRMVTSQTKDPSSKKIAQEHGTPAKQQRATPVSERDPWLALGKAGVDFEDERAVGGEPAHDACAKEKPEDHAGTRARAVVPARGSKFEPVEDRVEQAEEEGANEVDEQSADGKRIGGQGQKADCCADACSDHRAKCNETCAFKCANLLRS